MSFLDIASDGISNNSDVIGPYGLALRVIYNEISIRLENEHIRACCFGRRENINFASFNALGIATRQNKARQVVYHTLCDKALGGSRW